MSFKNRRIIVSKLREVCAIFAAALLSTLVHVLFAAAPGFDQTLSLSALAFGAGSLQSESFLRRPAKSGTAVNLAQPTKYRLLVRPVIYGLVAGLPLTVLWNNIITFAPSLTSYFANALSIAVAYTVGAAYYFWFSMYGLRRSRMQSSANSK